MHKEAEFSIHHSFWYFLNPAHWTTSSLCIAFIAFYAILIPAYFIIGFHPATAISDSLDAAEITSVSHLSIEGINIDASIIDIPLIDNHFSTPDYDIGRYISQSGTTFLFAHSISAFQHLDEVTSTDHILYDGHTYHITDISTPRVTDISMSSLLDQSEDTLILMTCAGELRAGDYTHRLIITATR